MKKYAFFKYFIKNSVFAGGGGGGARRLVPIWGRGWVFIFYPWYDFGTGAGAGCMEAGARTGMLKPAPDLPRCHVYLMRIEFELGKQLKKT